MSTTLYRMFDRDGKLLYVGISSNLDRRLGQHEAGKPWWPQVVEIKVEHHRTRALAEIAERNAIVTEKPEWNITHNLPGAKPHTPTFMALVKEWDRMESERENPKPEPEYVPPTRPTGPPPVCHICGHGILSTPSAVRIDGRIRLAHRTCRVAHDEEQREQGRADRQRELEDRRIAILRGDIA